MLRVLIEYLHTIFFNNYSMSITSSLPPLHITIFHRNTRIYVFIGSIDTPLNISRQKITKNLALIGHLRMNKTTLINIYFHFHLDQYIG
ncbi:hypothetical protein GQ56_0138585 [Burkholderia paludis]|nr:hypothetical protein GQ56_0138585 [Burkholderia paludis]